MDSLHITFCVILPPNPLRKNSTNSQINPETTDKHKNSKVCTIKISSDSCASSSIKHQDFIHERHKIFKDKKKKSTTMARTFNTTFLRELKIKLPNFNFAAKKLHEMPFDR